MEQPSTPSSLYGGRTHSVRSEKLSPVSGSSFRAFSRNLLVHQGGGASTVASLGHQGLPAPIALLSAGISDQPSIDKKVRLCDDKLARFVAVEETKFTLFDENAKKFIDQVGVMREDRERVMARKQAEIHHLSEVANEKVNGMIQARQESEARNEDRIYADLVAIDAEVKKLKSTREEAQGKYAKKIGEEIAKVYAQLDLVKDLRAQQGEKIANVIHEELVDLHNQVVMVKEARAESESEVMKMVEEMCFRIRAELDNERELRQHGEEQLLQLLEETCNRVEANFQIASGPNTRSHNLNS